MVTLGDRLGDDIFGLVDGDGVRTPPGALLAVIAEPAMQ
jgi:hypothetical protein